MLAKLTDAERDRLAAEDAAEVRREQNEAEAERRRTSRASERTAGPDVPASARAKVAVEYSLNQIDVIGPYFLSPHRNDPAIDLPLPLMAATGPG